MRNNVTWADLVACARRVGVEVVEAPSSHRGKLGSMGSVRGLTLHHTGTPNTYKPAEDYPDFNVVKEGRTGLVNSLSALGVGRHRAIYVFSEFLSWHAGTWNWKGITDGNGDFLGIECAGVGDYTPFQRAVYPRLVASLLLFLGEGVDWAPRHLDGATPRGRKSDAAHFETAFHNGMNFYDSVKFFMANPQYININAGGDDMANADDVMKEVGECRRLLAVLVGVYPPVTADEKKNLPEVLPRQGRPLDYRGAHIDESTDDQYGHVLSIRNRIEKMVADGVPGGVSVDAAEVARNLLADPGFAASLGKAIAADLASRVKE